MSTIERHRARRASTPHTAVMRRRAALLRRGRRLRTATEELLGPNGQVHDHEPDDINLLVAQLDVLLADGREMFECGVEVIDDAVGLGEVDVGDVAGRRPLGPVAELELAELFLILLLECQ